MHLVLVVFGVIGLALGGTLLLPANASAQTQSAEEQLARKYAPIIYIKKQPSECSTSGEAYLPVPVETVFDDPEVKLRRIAAKGESSDPVELTAPNATSLSGLGENYYLDLPGNPRNPGCSYEEWLRTKIKERGIQPTVYARVATEPDRPGKLAIQYWQYWVFNQFNNTHESDWEMVQLIFDAGTAEKALQQEPSSVVFAQHGGGEHADWSDEKLQREGDHLIVYPAAGSHASYYEDALWIGWGDKGSGFGCDDIQKPLVRLEPQIALIPDAVTPGGGFDWLAYEGHWGQRENWEFNGPTGPNSGAKWTQPISWTDGVRENSLPIPAEETVGPGAAGVFCSISGTVGSIFTVFPAFPRLTGIISAGIVIALLMLMLLGWRYIARATKLFVTHPAIFLPTSALMLLIAGTGAAIDDSLREYIPYQNGGVTGFSSMFQSSLGIGIQGIQQLLTYALVAPAIIYATYDIQRDDQRYGLRESWSVALRRFPTTFGAVFITLLFTGIMAATVILLPVAIYKAVRWLYTPHAVMIRDASWREARHVSGRVVRRHWWRTLGIAAAIALFSGVPGPIVGIVALILGHVSMETAGLISTMIYLIAYPIAVIASTLYFFAIGGLNVRVAETTSTEPFLADTPAPKAAPI
jgi:hypothetical protein